MRRTSRTDKIFITTILVLWLLPYVIVLAKRMGVFSVEFIVGSFGFSLAVLDFIGKTDVVEQWLRRIADKLTPLTIAAFHALSDRGTVLFAIGFSSLPGLLGALILGGFLADSMEAISGQRFDIASTSLWATVLFLAVCWVVSTLLLGVAAVLFLSVPMLIAQLLVAFANVLLRTPRGLIGCVAFLMASVDYLKLMFSLG